MEDKREDKTITIDFPKGNFGFYCMIRNSHTRVSGVLESTESSTSRREVEVNMLCNSISRMNVPYFRNLYLVSYCRAF